MGRKTPQEKADIAALRKADAALHANQRREEAAGIRHETPEYQRLNKAANDAADKVSWWRGGNR
ncbi:hypothetical protein [Streptomyces bauhiniae]|uniref:Uncharacterized protein n=1 Tax=Streptomyces bauhiniae TaxID=2340725 RepID=A0A7K3QRA1_9ACTN|nr:hypothetical protein [Streptomyces bauhiniae]NEB92424.1 hypothetical protein [Streptomyces bauhiniae]